MIRTELIQLYSDLKMYQKAEVLLDCIKSELNQRYREISGVGFRHLKRSIAAM